MTGVVHPVRVGVPCRVRGGHPAAAAQRAARRARHLQLEGRCVDRGDAERRAGAVPALLQHRPAAEDEAQGRRIG